MPTWPIRNKLLVGLGLLLVIVATLTWSGIHGLYSYRSLIKSLDRRLQELPLAADLAGRVSDLRAHWSELRTRGEFSDFQAVEQGLLPAGSWMAREGFRQRLAAVEKSLARYRELLERTGEKGSQIFDNRREWETAQQIAAGLSRIDKLTRDEDWVLDAPDVETIGPELEQLQIRANDLPNQLHQDVEAFVGEVKGQYRAMIVVGWATSVSTALMLVLFVRLFYVWIFRPLRVLVDGSRQVAGGQFDYRITVATRDEMQELAEAMNDMTARFRSIRDDLDRQVQERTKQVVRSEQLASVGFLAAGVAHEINNPLASIALCAESLETRLSDLLREDNPDHSVVHSYLRMIQDEAFRVKGITERLLDFSRIGEVRRQPADLRELVRGVIDMVGHLGRYHEKHVELLPGGPVTVSVNVQELKQVILNLLTNGLDSLESSGTVTVSVGCTGDQAELVVADDGCGMSPEVMEHLFEPFFTRRRSGQGTGLGLSISYRIIADHGGQIVARSAGVGRGSEFRVYLPREEESAEETTHRYQAA